MRKIPEWVKQGGNTAAAKKIMRDAILNKPEIQQALAKYINSLNLQGQVNKGLMTENQALQLFTKAVQQFKYQVNTKIDTCFTAQQQQMNQANLATPLNMQLALNNPNSLANQLMVDTAANILQSIQTEYAQDLEQNVQQQYQTEYTQEIEREDIQQEDMELQNVQQQSQEEEQERENPSMHDALEHDAEEIVKGATITEVIKALDDKPAAKETETLIEKAFHGITGKEGSFEKAAEETLSKAEELAKPFESTPVPRPPVDK